MKYSSKNNYYGKKREQHKKNSNSNFYSKNTDSSKKYNRFPNNSMKKNGVSDFNESDKNKVNFSDSKP